MKVSCHEEIFVGCRDVELLKVLFLDFWRMVNHQTRLPFGEYVVLIFANYQTCKSTTIMSWIQHQVRIERRSSINLCKFGAMRYSPPTPKKNHSPISSSSAGGELLALFVWLPIVKFRQDFHQQYLHVVGMEKAENSSWQLDWVRLLHLNKSYGKKNLQPQKHQQRIPDSSPEVVGFCKKKIARKMHCADGWTRDGASNVLFLCSARRRLGRSAVLGFLEPYFWASPQIWGWNPCNSLFFFWSLRVGGF